MRIVYVCGYRNTASGGVQNVFPEYINNISKYSNVLILNLGNSNLELSNDVIIFYDWRELLKQLKTTDLVIFHEVYYLKYYLFARELYKRHILYIIIPHGSFTKGAQSQKKIAKKIFNFIWIDRFVNQASAIQFLTESEWKNSVYAYKKHLIIPNGIYLTEKRKINFSNKNQMKLVFIGRLSIFYKGLDLLLEACKLIKNEMSQKHICLNIYGTDFEGDKNKLDKLIDKYELGDHITVYDGVFGLSKEKVLLDHDIFIQTSRFEGQPMGILEAMQYGLPLIVTPGTTFGNVVEDRQCGWKVGEEAKSIANGILQAYTDREKWEMYGQNARDVVRTEYIWDVVGERTIGEYKKRYSDQH